jgi:hypothetical protein
VDDVSFKSSGQFVNGQSGHEQVAVSDFQEVM